MESQINLINNNSKDCSKVTTRNYSTSFTLGIKTLNKKFHKPIYAIYGFVRLADEIVDSFYEQNQKNLLQEFKKETYNSIRRRMSLNPILNSFQICVNKYKIHKDLID